MPEYHIISKNLSKLELELLKIARDRQLLWFEFYLLSPIFSPETSKAYSTFPFIIFSLKPERWRKYSISSVSLVPFLANNLQQASSVKDLNRITTEPILRFTTSIWKFSAIRSLKEESLLIELTAWRIVPSSPSIGIVTMISNPEALGTSIKWKNRLSTSFIIKHPYDNTFKFCNISF